MPKRNNDYEIEAERLDDLVADCVDRFNLLDEQIDRVSEMRDVAPQTLGHFDPTRDPLGTLTELWVQTRALFTELLNIQDELSSRQAPFVYLDSLSGLVNLEDFEQRGGNTLPTDPMMDLAHRIWDGGEEVGYLHHTSDEELIFRNARCVEGIEALLNAWTVFVPSARLVNLMSSSDGKSHPELHPFYFFFEHSFVVPREFLLHDKTGRGMVREIDLFIGATSTRNESPFSCNDISSRLWITGIGIGDHGLYATGYAEDMAQQPRDTLPFVVRVRGKRSIIHTMFNALTGALQEPKHLMASGVLVPAGDEIADIESRFANMGGITHLGDPLALTTPPRKTLVLPYGKYAERTFGHVPVIRYNENLEPLTRTLAPPSLIESNAPAYLGWLN
jgi:hypothetical protein